VVTPVAPVQLATAVDDAVTVVFARLHVPNIIPLIVPAVLLPPTIKLVVLAVVVTSRFVPTVSAPVVEALPLIVTESATASPKVTLPFAVRVPAVAKFPLVEVVVAKPFTHKLPPTVSPLVVDALPVIIIASAAASPKVTASLRVVAPLTVSDPPVVIFVLIVVAADAAIATKTNERTTENATENMSRFLNNFFIRM